MARRCSKCKQQLARDVLVDVPAKLVVTKTKDKDGSRKVITDLSAVAWQELCYFCYGRMQKLQKDQCVGNTDIIFAKTEQFDSFCDTYSDICGAHGISNCVDKYGKNSALDTDMNGTFVQGKHIQIEVGSYFNNITEHVPDEKKSELESDDIEIVGDLLNAISTTTDDVNPHPVESPHNTRFTTDNIITLNNFIEAKQFDGISTKRFLEKQKYIEYLKSKNIKTRNSVDSYVTR